MNIEIAGRCRPFSHRPGTCFVLPKSSISIQVFPTYLIFSDLSQAQEKVIGQLALDVKGPVDNFTVLQDLEKMHIRVWGHAKAGYFRYRIEVAENRVDLVVEKGSFEIKAISCLGEPCASVEGRYRLLFACAKNEHGKISERLSLGNHKAQNVCLMKSRVDFSEILPLWHRLGLSIPSYHAEAEQGIPGLLKICKKAVQNESAEQLLSSFHSLFLAGFNSWLSPRLTDTDFQGIVESDRFINTDSPLALLSEGAQMIRSLFVQQHNDELKVLPALPKELHCGRFIDVPCGDWGMLSIEWSKKSIKKVVVQALKTRSISLMCSDDEKSCRLRTGNKDRGTSYPIKSSLNIVEGQTYWFDNFQR